MSVSMAVGICMGMSMSMGMGIWAVYYDPAQWFIQPPDPPPHNNIILQNLTEAANGNW